VNTADSMAHTFEGYVQDDEDSADTDIFNEDLQQKSIDFDEDTQD